MNKAVLLSVLIFPGSGHLLLKKYRTGISLMVSSAIALIVLVYHLTQQLMGIMKKIQSGEIPQADLLTISEALSQSDTLAIRVSTTILLILWIFSIADSYRISRNINNKISENS